MHLSEHFNLSSGITRLRSASSRSETLDHDFSGCAFGPPDPWHC